MAGIVKTANHAPPHCIVKLSKKFSRPSPFQKEEWGGVGHTDKQLNHRIV